MMNEIDIKAGLHTVAGFTFSGVCIGDENKKNLALIFSEVKETIGVAVYTKNDVKAAPVLISQQHDSETPIKRVVLINSGQANAFTGKKGFHDAYHCVSTVANRLSVNKEHVYLGSTGSIGYPIPIDDIIDGIDKVSEGRGSSFIYAQNFIEATMTTDTRPKQAGIRYIDNGKIINIGATVKGSGMIMPNMATMLCTVLTDVNISHDILKSALNTAIDKSFHCTTVDGDTSTNDTVFLLANGYAKNKKIELQDASYELFVKNLTKLLEHLAKEMIADGEGITKFITIKVSGVPSEENGKSIAFSIANSPLVKTALFGEQMNWGRILMAAGKAYTGLDFNRLNMKINNIQVIRESEPTDDKSHNEAAQTLKNRDIEICLDLNQGDYEFTAWTCDFSYEYVKINAGYIS